MTSMNNAFSEGQSIARPPMFNGSDYAYWKARMKIYLVSVDYDVWDIIETGYTPPTETVNGIVTPKPKSRWDANDKKLYSIDSKAMNALICALDKTEYNRISHCNTAQEIWHTLEVTHEGTSQVKESRLAMFSNEYENFNMQKDESIKDMYGRFSVLVYNARALGKVYTEVELVRKILRVLPMNFEAKVTAIQESKDLSKLSMEELIGNLMTYEMELKAREDRNNSDLKKKSIALSNTVTSDSEDPIEQLAMAVRQLTKWRKFKPRRNKPKTNNSEDEPLCYNCQKPGHIKPNCPLLQRNKKKKKAFAVTWDDEEGEEDSDSSEEESNLCFMAKSDLEDTDEETTEVYSYDDLVLMCKHLSEIIDTLESDAEKLKAENFNLVHNNKKLESEIKNASKTNNLDCEMCKDVNLEILTLKSTIENLEKENLTLKVEDDTKRRNYIKRCTSLVNENTILKTRVQDLEVTLNKFSIGQTSFKMLLGNQLVGNNRKGLGFGKIQEITGSDNAKGKSIFPKCVKCGVIGHSHENCKFSSKIQKFKKVWVPKHLAHNYHKDWNTKKNQIWIPKESYDYHSSTTDKIRPRSFSRSSPSLFV